MWFLALVAFHLSNGVSGWDFPDVFYPAARDVLDGVSPFPQPGSAEILSQQAYVYPPLAALLVTPVTVLPVDVAFALAIAVLTVSVGLALWLLGVRDWRCYGVALAWAPLVDGLLNATVSAGLCLLLAVAWRRRDATTGAAATGLSVALKLYLWPLLVWHLAAGRRRVAFWAGAVAVVAVLVPWAVIGFAGLRDYPTILRELAGAEQTLGVSVVAAAASLGAPVALARAITLVLGAVALVLCWRSGRSGRDVLSLTWALAAATVLTPVAWQHYWAVFLVPLAIVAPRLSALWLVPVACWVGVFWRSEPLARTACVALAAVLVVGIARRAATGAVPDQPGTRSSTVSPPSR